MHAYPNTNTNTNPKTMHEGAAASGHALDSPAWRKPRRRYSLTLVGCNVDSSRRRIFVSWVCNFNNVSTHVSGDLQACGYSMSPLVKTSPQSSTTLILGKLTSCKLALNANPILAHLLTTQLFNQPHYLADVEISTWLWTWNRPC